jgi:alpha-amylase
MQPFRWLLVLPIALALATCASQSRRRPPTRVVAPRGSAQWSHDWAKGAVFYEIFVRSFSDSNGDGKGDLAGLISRLDYLNDGNPATSQDLGVDALWLMPVFASPSYHGYDTTDYETIEPDYGSNADFERLLAEAHRRGIRVIVDFVVNHSSSEHPWFQESSSSPSSPRRDWYVWSPLDPGWTQPWGNNATWHPRNGAYYYGVFWGGMPDLNWRTPAVRAEMTRLAKLWLDLGVDGFRLDATRHLVETGPGPGQSDTPETHAALKELAAAIRATHPDAVLVGENWTETPAIAAYYGSSAIVAGGDELPMNFDFPLATEIVAGVRSGNAAGIAAKLVEIAALYPPGALDAPFLTNHDQVRLATQLDGNGARMRNASAILLTLPGAPFLYYGEEVGLANGPTGNDEAKRTPMPWDSSSGGGFTTGVPWFPFAPGRESANVAAQNDRADSLLSRYRALIRARKSSSALRRGDLRLLTVSAGSSPVLAFLRTDGDDRVLVAHNVSDAVAIAGPLAVSGASGEKIFGDAGVGELSGSSGAWTIALPPRASAIFRIR